SGTSAEPFVRTHWMDQMTSPVRHFEPRTSASGWKRWLGLCGQIIREICQAQVLIFQIRVARIRYFFLLRENTKLRARLHHLQHGTDGCARHCDEENPSDRLAHGVVSSND
ncbi:MAG: YaaL family protein, partial [Acidobacteria bacterium]|nr:YaaL family protein [Acidobacteriota bacterium]